jgi:CheY-like chemotaxis protein
VCGWVVGNIEADRSQLDVCLVNLVLNARDAMPAGGTVRIKTSHGFLKEQPTIGTGSSKPETYAVIEVTDTGTGMSEDVAARAFEPFFTTKSQGQGTGLGLSQVYGFVSQSGGHTEILSEVGRGTTVRMYFPTATGPSEVATSPKPESCGSGEGESILVVEDEPEVRRYVADTLRDLNYLVDEASSAEEALKLIQSKAQTFDLLLTDIVMPGLNGKELADRVKKISSATAVVFMTGYSGDAIIHDGKVDAGLNVLQKPFTREQLDSQIESALKTKRSKLVTAAPRP